jgi:hypothetical protein
MKKTILAILLVALCPFAGATNLDSIAARLAGAPVQEKVWLHLDNNCYFKGDTIWYKSYVVRADDLSYSDMSRLVYVELVSPDGLVVERHQLIASEEGYGDGCFVLKDSLYSGYYELRAYTRWMLNFRVTEHPNTITDRHQFYNRQMAHDFFRQYGTIYSRVVPVYERPDSVGDYGQRYIVSRPKTRLEKELKERLTVNFYPEGGHLIAGTRCTVAFEALNEEGACVDISGTLIAGEGSESEVSITTVHQGRGRFTVDVPTSGQLSARFRYNGKDYTFDLPKSEKQGCALHLYATHDELTAHLAFQGLPPEHQYGVAVLCRGVLKSFQTIQGSQQLRLDKTLLPTGVCDLIVIDDNGQPMADRLFFVNHHDLNMEPVTFNHDKTDFQPFDSITLHFQAPAGTKHFSISVRDGAGDDPTYDTGSIMTDLLLSSDLKGFVAWPDYYFEADDDTHREHLDLLMMVQGWRRYDYDEMTSGQPLRYEPEKTMTVEGAVYKTVTFEDLRECEIPFWLQGIFGWCDEDVDHMDPNDPEVQKKEQEEEENEDSGIIESGGETEDEPGFRPHISEAHQISDPEHGVNHGGLSYEVILTGELALNEEVATVEMETTDGGRFAFNIPPYYGDGILFLSAHKKNISERKQHRLETKGRLDEDEWPEFYVKRDLFYPIFARKYDYYQCHQPETPADMDEPSPDDQLADNRRLSKFDAQLKGIEVKAKRRRGRQAIDYSKPAYVYDTYELYNLATDYGLSFGKLNFRRFPIQVSMLLLGNYNSNQFFNVEARMSDNVQNPYVFFRNYSPDASINTVAYRSNYAVFSNLHLNRQDEIRLFTDFELRNEDKPKEHATTIADVTLDFRLMPDDSKRYTYRDRRIILHGIHDPASFYHPDYSRQPLPETVKDYRRTLYWNPNAKPDADGRFTARFYNNGKPTRIKVSTAGVFKKE